MHNWIYITHLDEIFIFGFSHEKCRLVAVGLSVRDTPMLVWLGHGMTLLCVPNNTVAWLQDTLLTFWSIRLFCTAHRLSFSYSLKPLAADWLRLRAQLLTSLLFSLSGNFTSNACEEFARYCKYTRRSASQALLIWSLLKYMYEKRFVLTTTGQPKQISVKEKVFKLLKQKTVFYICHKCGLHWKLIKFYIADT